MKKCFLIIIGLLCFPYVLQSEVNTAVSDIKWNGYLLTDNRLALNGENEYTWQETRLALQMDAKPTEKTHFYSEIWVRSLGFPAVQNSADLTDKQKVAPLNLDFREAYVDLYGCFFEKLDLRIGKQRIAWGTADKMNPTDNINPKDLEDMWDFGRYLGSEGIKASYYLSDFTFTGVCIPQFTPAVLPQGDIASALSPAMTLPAGMSVRNIASVVALPRNNPEESSTAGIKVSKNILGYDFSLSYASHRDDLPLADRVSFAPTGSPGQVDIATELIYPKVRVAGMDMSGSIGNVGIWFEAATSFPDEVKMTTDLTALGMGTSESITLEDKPYTKYAAGVDYTFKSGIYTNVQYVHGFFHERGEENLEDYLTFAMDCKFLDDKLKITPIGGAAVVKDFNDVENNYGIAYCPEIAYTIDNAELSLGARLIDGTDTTIFGRMKDNDDAYIKVKYSF